MSTQLCTTAFKILNNQNNINETRLCLTSSTVSEKLALESAWKFSPVFHFHDLEQYMPMDPIIWYKQSKLYDSNGHISRINSDKNYLSVIQNITSPVIMSSVVNNNQTTAPLYVRVFKKINSDSSFTWIYSYFMFYSMNGCSSQMLRRDVLNQQEMEQFVTCDLGVHEGDWEMVSVEVCSDLSSIILVNYNSHDFNYQTKCGLGECIFSNETIDIENKHPIAYVSLNTHGTYPFPATNIIYDYISLDVIGFDALYLVDRTQHGYRKFIPNKNNVITMINNTGNINETTHILEWVRFNGRWGKSYETKSQQVKTSQCLIDNTLVDCSKNNRNFFTLLQNIINEQFTSIILTQLNPVKNQLQNALYSNGPHGPISKSGFYSLDSIKLPNIISLKKTNICPDVTKLVLRIINTPYSNNSKDFWDAFYILMKYILPFLVCIYIIWYFGNKKIEYKQSRIGIMCSYILHRFPIGSTSILICIYSTIIPYYKIFNNFLIFIKNIPIETIKTMNIWNRIEQYGKYLFAFVICFNFLFWFYSIIIKNVDRFLKLTQKKSLIKYKNHYWICSTFMIIFVMFCLIASSISLIFAAFLWGVNDILLYGCLNAGQTSGLCINLKPFGMEIDICGNQLLSLCSDFSDLSVKWLQAYSIFYNVMQIIMSGFFVHNLTILYEIINDLRK